MPKLYYTASSCSLASFISAFTAKLSIECEIVNTQTHLTASGVDFYTINPKGNVPALVLDDGTVLNENAATLQWIADQVPNSVAAENGTTERYLIQQALSYVGSEVHVSIGGLFRASTDGAKEYLLAGVDKRLTYLNNVYLAGKKYIVGDKFTIADAYLFVVLSWTGYLKIDLSPYPVVHAYYNSIAELSNVVEAKARIATNPTTTY